MFIYKQQLSKPLFMNNFKNPQLFYLLLLLTAIVSNPLKAQETTIRGFIETNSTISDDIWSFGFGEQDLFITSELNDHISFLGETVFKYDANASTKFSVSIERVIIKYNFKGNHSVLLGKHHTPVNFWNDTYHHGRVFFPTIDRPHLFEHNIIPIHTTGVGLQGLNLGKNKVGYNFMVGNGIGSSDIGDNNNSKSITAAVNFEPLEKLKVGASFYNDVISAGTIVHGNIVNEQIKQHLITTSLSYFDSKYEVLAEATFSANKAQSTGVVNSFAGYLYGGFRVKEKWVPYFRIDLLNFEADELYYINDDTTAFVVGIRHEFNYLAVIKLEYQYDSVAMIGDNSKLKLQFAIGF